PLLGDDLSQAPLLPKEEAKSQDDRSRPGYWERGPHSVAIENPLSKIDEPIEEAGKPGCKARGGCVLPASADRIPIIIVAIIGIVVPAQAVVVLDQSQVGGLIEVQALYAVPMEVKAAVFGFSEIEAL